jgi:hypothetical protein
MNSKVQSIKSRMGCWRKSEGDGTRSAQKMGPSRGGTAAQHYVGVRCTGVQVHAYIVDAELVGDSIYSVNLASIFAIIMQIVKHPGLTALVRSRSPDCNCLHQRQTVSLYDNATS